MMHISNWVPTGKQKTFDSPARLWIAEPMSRQEFNQPARVAAQSFLILALIVAATFALLVALDYAGIHIAPTDDMLAAG